jgi:hypothetical protein
MITQLTKSNLKKQQKKTHTRIFQQNSNFLNTSLFI